MKSIIICDLEGVIEKINPDGEKLFGYSKEELVGKKRVSLFSAGEIVIQNVGNWLASGLIFSITPSRSQIIILFIFNKLKGKCNIYTRK
jgi:PAS domain-containing protein